MIARRRSPTLGPCLTIKRGLRTDFPLPLSPPPHIIPPLALRATPTTGDLPSCP
jgi:hypothetical protein